MLNDAINLADSFTEDSFLQRYSKSWNSFIPLDNGIYKYQNMLVEITSSLDNLIVNLPLFSRKLIFRSRPIEGQAIDSFNMYSTQSEILDLSMR